MKHFLLRSLNRVTWIYPYLGLPYALFFMYAIVVPAYRERDQLTSPTCYLLFNVIFFYFFLQAYWNLLLTRLAPIHGPKDEKCDRHCQICSINIPARSYHCYLCERCIPSQDHHCFFVGCCVGQHNLRYFLLMLFHLFAAHVVGYAFVCDYLWTEIGGVTARSIMSIPFFNIGYFIGLIETKWQVFICFHHYLVYFNWMFMGHLFVHVLKRSLKGQTAYEEKKGIVREKQSLAQIFHCSNKWRLLWPLFPSSMNHSL